ncbi:MMPL family transporter [Streptomyces sp. G45]|uniref:MMPL family transporter n=1 Tax=Streptomyces sp. G45 TaxID=3406627 RepID=UPI003C151894
MATILYKLGRFAFRRRGLMALLWVLIFGGVGFAASTAPAPPADTFSMPGTESQKAYDLLDDKFPDASADGATARVVLRAPDGKKITDPAEKAKVAKVAAELRKSPQVASVSDPYAAGGAAVSKDKTTVYVSATYKVVQTEVNDKAHDAIDATLEHARDSGLTAEAGGDAVKVEQGVKGSSEAIGIVVSAIVLILTFGSMIAAGMPLLTALVGVGVGISGITALGTTLGLSSTTTTLAMMIGLAVGIDYALFIVSRYRSEVTDGRARDDAAGRAVGTAGTAVVFAGLTVVIALVGLAVVNIPMLTKMGMAAAGTVAVAVLIAVTLVPALLGFAPVKVLARKDRARFRGKPLSEKQQRKAEQRQLKLQRPNMGARWAQFILRHPVAVLLLAVVGLGAVAVPAANMKLGLPSEGTMAPDTTQRKAYDMMSDSFGKGFNGPLMVTIEAPGVKAKAEGVRARMEKEPGVESVGAAAVNKAGDTAIVNVVPQTGPAEDKTKNLVKSLRGMAKDIKADNGPDILLTGQTAMFIDFSKTLDDALLPYLGTVVGLAFVLLMLVFRSVLVPLKAALGFLLSVAAALGAVVAVFQEGHLADVFGVDQPGPIVSTMPIFMIGVVFGLAMDYEVFLVTRMREAYVHGADPREAVVTGFRFGGRVVAAAAVIMISVFSGFILEENDLVKMIGFGLAAAVLFDAFVVRMTLVPALFALLGRAAWWLPRWLDWLLPNMDVEGEKLARRLAADQQVPPQQRHPEPQYRR